MRFLALLSLLIVTGPQLGALRGFLCALSSSNRGIRLILVAIDLMKAKLAREYRTGGGASGVLA